MSKAIFNDEAALEAATQPAPTTVTDELKAMAGIVKILERLDGACRDRIAGWVYDRYRAPAEEA